MGKLIKIENHGYQDLELDNAERDCVILSASEEDELNLIVISREAIPQLIELLQKEVK